MRGTSVSTISRMAKKGRLRVAFRGPGLRGPMYFNRADIEALAAAEAAASTPQE